jgi:hypothetical protein
MMSRYDMKNISVSLFGVSDTHNINQRYLSEIRTHLNNEMRIAMLDHKPWAFQVYQLQSYKTDSTFHSPNDTHQTFDQIMGDMMKAIDEGDDNAYIDAYARFYGASLSLNRAYEDMRDVISRLQDTIFEIDRISRRIDSMGDPIGGKGVSQSQLETERNIRKRSDLKFKWKIDQELHNKTDEDLDIKDIYND